MMESDSAANEIVCIGAMTFRRSKVHGYCIASERTSAYETALTLWTLLLCGLSHRLLISALRFIYACHSYIQTVVYGHNHTTNYTGTSSIVTTLCAHDAHHTLIRHYTSAVPSSLTMGVQVKLQFTSQLRLTTSGLCGCCSIMGPPSTCVLGAHSLHQAMGHITVRFCLPTPYFTNLFALPSISASLLA